jgi:hypothetical protein
VLVFGLNVKIVYMYLIKMKDKDIIKKALKLAHADDPSWKLGKPIEDLPKFKYQEVLNGL